MPYVTTTIDQRGVATVTLDNPDKHNAFDDNIIGELSRTFNAVNANRDVRIMVLASTGKSFSAGGDLDWMKRMAGYSREENFADAQTLAAMFKTLNFMTKPTIARVQGAAFGGAVGLISCCDMAVATEQAVFSLSEARIGLIPATISPYVIAAIGQRAARRYFTTAERFDAFEALKLDLVSQLVSSPDALDDAVAQLVDQLLRCSPAAVAAAKQLVFDMDRDITDPLIAETCKRIADIRVSPQGQEGLAAFLQKRQPGWAQ
nr:putative enoyl-CoA hydratase/isomerase family protein [uncultured bacterium]